MNTHFKQAIGGAVVLACTLALPISSAFAGKPNIVLIMCDDMGFSDLGCYGSEIKTPNIDALAKDGIRFSQFKNTSRCCPSRAVLMTGHNQYAVGMGWMTAVDEHRPSYRGQLTDKIPTIAEVLKGAGYGTYLSGKWHLTVDGSYYKVKNPAPNGSWPFQRGFDETYGGLSGGGGYRKVTGLVRNDTFITKFPKDYYYTTAITENAVDFIGSHDASKPLFLYLAHYAPHRPLQAPKERIDVCRKRYKVGYDVLREARYERLRKLGVLPDDSERSIALEGHKPWAELDQKTQSKWITEMATYAAMVEMVDDGIGEVVDSLKKKGMFDDTIILFLSDNGATSEGGEVSKLAAGLSNTPYRSYKKYSFNGGISSPLIIHYPKKLGSESGSVRHGLAHISDLVPTCLEMANVEYPATFRGNQLTPPDGVSLVPMLAGKAMPPRDLFFEHSSSCAIISGDWKLVRESDQEPWVLINLKSDPFEQNDVLDQYPEVADKLKAKWAAWGKANGVFPIVNMPWGKRIDHFTELNPDQDGIN